jgi:glucose/arabinose dehydrogenase
VGTRARQVRFTVRMDAVVRALTLVAASLCAAVPVAGCASSRLTAASAVDPAGRAAGLRLIRVGTFAATTFATGAPGDTRRLFVVEKGGTIAVVVNGRKQARAFLDISNLVNAGANEQGLLSMAFAPDYERSGRFYVYYTDGANNIRIVQYRRAGRDPNRADPASARPVLTIDHHTETNHNGGQLQFGPDGDLYIGVGDGGNEGDPHDYGQNTGVLLGKLLRIRPQAGGGYAIPPGNPFAGRSGRRAEIWAYGLRNPWRFSFDRLTGDLAIADVGQDEEEEIDFARRGRGAGANYGWSVFEGDHRYKPGSAPGSIAPELVAHHSAGYCAIVGGYVVRDRSLPGLYGRYLYGDNCKPQISSVKLNPGHAVGNRATGLSVSALSSFGQDTAGHIYAVSLSGPVYRLAAR